MKSIVHILLQLLMCFLGIQLHAQAIQVKTSVNKALLYSNGAFITRNAQVLLKNGKNNLKITELPGNIQMESLQVTPDDNMNIISIQPYYSNEKSTSEWEVLKKTEDSLSRQKIKLDRLDMKVQVLMEEENILKKNQPSFTNDYMIKPVELKEVIEFNSAKLLEIYTKKSDLKEEISLETKSMESIKMRYLSLVQKINQNSIEIEIEAESNGERNATLTLTYFSYFASWVPVYDLRVENVEKPLEITLKASIIQNTQEDWKDVELSVSNGQPSSREIEPDIKPWFLAYQSYETSRPVKQGKYNPDIRSVKGKIKDRYGEALIGALILITEQPSVGTITDIDGSFVLPIPSEAKSITVSYVGFNSQTRYVESEVMDFLLEENMGLLDEVVVLGGVDVKQHTRKIDEIISDYSINPTKISYQPTTFSFKVQEKVSINSSTNPSIHDIYKETIPAIYEYSSTPKYDPSVFLNAGLKDWKDYNLLSGKVNLYLEGKYTGQTMLDLKMAKDTLWLTLGRDKNVLIERTKIKEFVKRSYFSGNTIETQAFHINIQNNKKEAIKIKIKDHLPISNNKEIEIFDQSYDGAAVDPISKIITWNLEVLPQTEIKKELKFSVKYPNRASLNLD